MKSGKYRYIVAILLFVAGIINYMDRAALGVAAPFVRKDLGLSPSALGVIFSTFFFGYAIFAFVGGQLADKYGPRVVYTWAAACLVGAVWPDRCGHRFYVAVHRAGVVRFCRRPDEFDHQPGHHQLVSA